LSTAPTFADLPVSGQQSLQGAAGSGVASGVGSGVAVAKDSIEGSGDGLGAATGAVQPARSTATATIHAALGRSFLIRYHFTGRSVVLLGATDATLGWLPREPEPALELSQCLREPLVAEGTRR